MEAPGAGARGQHQEQHRAESGGLIQKDDGEHGRLREEFERATKVGGETAEAARAVLKVLLPHMMLEEEPPPDRNTDSFASERLPVFARCFSRRD